MIRVREEEREMGRCQNGKTKGGHLTSVGGVKIPLTDVLLVGSAIRALTTKKRAK